MRPAVWLLGAALALVLVLALAPWPRGEVSPAATRATAPPAAREPPAPLSPLRAPPAGERQARLEVASRAELPAEPERPTARPVLRGLLLDEATRLPLPGHGLRLATRFGSSRPPISVRAGADGTFAVGLDPGELLALYEPDHDDPERALARVVAPQTFEVPSGVGQHEQTFLLRAPPAALEVEVVDAAGAPVPAAWVVFVCRVEDEPLVDPRQRTDAEGRARLGVWSPEAFEHGHVRAWDDGGRVSELLAVASPFVPGPRRLLLRDAAAVEVLVKRPDAEGAEPVAGRRVLLASDEPLGTRRYEETDESGRYVFRDVFPGSYTVSAARAAGGGYGPPSPLALAHGERAAVVLVVEREDPRRLAVGGRVVDEQGRPLGGASLVIEPQGEWPWVVLSDGAGEFEAWAEPCPAVTVRADVAPEGDTFEPSSLTVPHGTRDVLLRRRAAAQRREFEVEVRDRVTGEELREFTATLDRGPGSERWSDTYAGRRAFSLRLLSDARWRVAAPDHVVRELALWPALEALEPGQRLRVDLDPGLDHVLEVLDADTRAPLEGVFLRDELGGVRRTDALGRARLVGAVWTASSASKEGYATAEWDPRDALLWDWGPLLLERER